MSQWTHVNLVAELRFHECMSRTELKEQVEQALGDSMADTAWTQTIAKAKE